MVFLAIYNRDWQDCFILSNLFTLHSGITGGYSPLLKLSHQSRHPLWILNIFPHFPTPTWVYTDYDPTTPFLGCTKTGITGTQWHHFFWPPGRKIWLFHPNLNTKHNLQSCRRCYWAKYHVWQCRKMAIGPDLLSKGLEPPQHCFLHVLYHSSKTLGNLHQVLLSWKASDL